MKITSPAQSTALPSSSVESATDGDERIIHRGPMRRWLISPEIGALIGAVVVWLFLWGCGETFGTAGTTLNWLDVAAPYGIMATAIGLLMIGGEFDLSSGVMTGASAMSIGFLSRFFKGSGVHIGYAIAATFLAAIAIGWFNGYMVNKTGLPSFIITLSTFFVSRGMMLVLSKRLADKVYVDQIKDQRGAAGFGNWVAHEWLLTEFPARDKIFVACGIIGVVLFAYGLMEQSFIRREMLWVPGIAVCVIGAAIGAAGFGGLLTTDGLTNNYLFGAVTAIGSVIALVGMALTRWVRRDQLSRSPGTASLHGSEGRIGIALFAVVLACLIHIPFDRGERRAVLTWIDPRVRPVVVLLAAAVGIALSVRSLLPSLRNNAGAGARVKMVIFSLYSGLALLTLTVSVLQLATIQAVRATAMLVLGGGGIVLFLVERAKFKGTNQAAQLLCSMLASTSAMVLGLVTRADSTATRFRVVLPAVMTMFAAGLMVNSLVEFFMKKRTSANTTADRLGRRLQIAGAAIAIFGGALRVLYSNLSPAHAERLRAEGASTPQNVLRETVLWWLLVAAIGAYVLVKTRWGNWIFAVGGNKDAARAIGVPADRVKIALFMVVSVCAALSGTLIALRYGTVQADQGTGLEFEYIIAAVVGGCLMTGGYGTVIGASLGAVVLATSTTGFQTVVGWNSDARYAFLGGILLIAVLVNDYTRRKAREAR